ncbi:MAG: N-acetyl-gamma-glutamyl-phosphate reductase [Oscillospiraceae bacterium]|nr:N-acetyl-gamma-glutamyl-phosphate reductase [Oscillospiraceae bacterium]MCR4761867.1 N-acetyl-gamma-glutamyl-phosphate reductase [Oscillospiraceae bacterium]
MKTTKVYIDGQAGTTGLKLYDRIRNRPDVELLTIDPALHRDNAERARLINLSDVTFLCLPDAASIEAVSFVENPDTRIIDASTAHRTNPDWAYGFPELSPAHREKILSSKRVAVPGCYASGFASLVYPMVQSGMMQPDYPVTCHAVSGYSGAGKNAIAVYESDDRPAEFGSPRQYALGQKHKHLPEMQKVSGLAYPPMFNPLVCDYYAGMVVSVPLHRRLLNGKPSLEEVHAMFEQHYAGQQFVKVRALQGTDVLENGFLPANTLAGTNLLEVFVCGNDEQILLAARLDNLGKGASGAALQCFNIMTGAPEETGLV